MSEKEMIQSTATNDELLASKIFIIREQKVMLDSDLAEFMFELTKEETVILRSQFGTLKTSGAYEIHAVKYNLQ